MLAAGAVDVGHIDVRRRVEVQRDRRARARRVAHDVQPAVLLLVEDVALAEAVLGAQHGLGHAACEALEHEGAGQHLRPGADAMRVGVQRRGVALVPAEHHERE